LSLSQAKIDLSVLYKLHQHAEAGGGAITPGDVAALFRINLSLRRIEVSLRELTKRGEVEEEYHPFYRDEGLWQISRDGLMKVDRALRVPQSFMARLHSNGDQWLESEEAAQSVLNKLPSKAGAALPEVHASVSSREVIIPTFDPLRPISGEQRSINWTMWGAIAAILAIPTAIALWIFS
jgi:hypothetical protein